MNPKLPALGRAHPPTLVLLVPEGQQVSADLLNRLGSRLRSSGWPLQVSFRVEPRLLHGCNYQLQGHWTGSRTEFHALLISLFCEFASLAATEGDSTDA